jgi:hypothetical protein
VGDLLGRQRVHRPARGAAPLALAGDVLHLPPHLVELGLVPLGEPVLRAAQAEVDLEDGLERPPVSVVLHQRRPERVLEGVPIVDGDVLNRLHRVEVLGEAHRQPGVAQLDDEAVEQIEHGAGARVLGDGHRVSSRRRALWPSWRCRSDT